MRLNKNIFKTAGSIKTTLGSAGYDNSRENIDPHIKTQVVSSREGSVEKVPVNNSDITNKQYVDANDFWIRTGTILEPKTAGDDIKTTGKFHAFDDSSDTTGNEGLLVEQDGSGDASIVWKLSGGRSWRMGIDNSKGDRLSIASNSGGADDLNRDIFQLDETANLTLNNNGFTNGGELKQLSKVNADSIIQIFTATADRGGGNGGAGLGFKYLFRMENAGGVRHDAGGFIVEWTVPTAASEESKFTIETYEAGIAVTPLIAQGSNVGIAVTPTIKLDVNGKSGHTAEGGFAIKLTNDSGSTSVAGDVVKASVATADAVEGITSNGTEPMGVWYESGVTDGSEGWVVISGIADVHMDAGGSGVGDRIITSGTAGRGFIWNIGGAVATHFQEIGHCIESAAANGTARCILHFN